jgi:hypothetical protein
MNNKRTFLLLAGLLSTSISLCFGQNVGISTAVITPDASSMLEVRATNKGVLIPRVALTATNDAATVPAAATSLLVYNTATAGVSPNNVVPGYYYNAGTPAVPVWTRFASGNSTAWTINGNAGTSIATNFLGTTDAVDFGIRTTNVERIRIAAAGNVGVGMSAPASLFHSAGQISSGIPSGGLGGAAANTGSVLLYNSSNGNTITLQSGVTTATHTLTLPTTQGGAGTYLRNDGAGNLTWVTAGAASMSYSQTTTLFGTTTILKSVTVTTVAGSEVFIHGESDFAKNATTSYYALGLYRDGVEIHEVAVYAPANADQSIHIQWVDTPAAGSHTYDIRWKVGAGGVSTQYGSGLRVILFN